MNEAQSDAQFIAENYLAPSTDAMWHWTEDGKAVCWSDGRTIAFRQQVEHVIARIAPAGLPPLGSIVLMLAACRDGWAESNARRSVAGYANAFSQWQTQDDPRVSSQAPQLVFAHVAAHVQNILMGLDQIGALPANLRQSKEAQAVIAETIFEPGQKAFSAEHASAVVRALADGVNPESLIARFSNRDAFSQFAAEADAMLPGLAGITAESLAIRTKTGLDELIGEAEVELSPSERVRNLLKELMSDAELSGLAKLAQNIMAAVHVPRALHQPEELPVGGVSDLSNRGSLDRLLISELANDELTLAVRVAMNEALYLRRESPPKQPPNHRAILLDLGIRLWGVPRVFAIATAMAMIATADRKSQIETYRAAGDRVEPIDLTTRDGLVECMGILEPSPHPGDALKAFANEIGQSDDAETDCILITHADVLPDAAFAPALKPLQESGIYLATVSNTGDFQFLAASNAGRKVVSRAKLDLAGLSGQNEKPRTQLITGTSAKDYPAILTLAEFPLRLSAKVDPRNVAVSKRWGLCGITQDGRFMHWPSELRGGTQLAANIPCGSVKGVAIDDESGTAFACVSHRNPRGCTLLYTADLHAGTSNRQVVQEQGPMPRVFLLLDGTPIIISAESIVAINPNTGRQLAIKQLDPWMTWRHGRYFQNSLNWYALSYSAGILQLAQLPYRHKSPQLIHTLFDRPTHQEPWAVLANGALVNCATQQQCSTNLLRPLDKVKISADASRLIGRQGNSHFICDFTKGLDWQPLERDPDVALLPPEFSRAAAHWSPAHLWYDGITVGEWGHLCLKSGDAARAIGKHATSLQPRLFSKTFTGRTRASVAPFVRIEPPGNARYGLALATWKDGSKAWYDSRGLLHLRSSDKYLPELTVVLYGDPISAYSTDGRLFGRPYFFGAAAKPLPAGELWNELQRFIARLV